MKEEKELVVEIKERGVFGIVGVDFEVERILIFGVFEWNVRDLVFIGVG